MANVRMDLNYNIYEGPYKWEYTDDEDWVCSELGAIRTYKDWVRYYADTEFFYRPARIHPRLVGSREF